MNRSEMLNGGAYCRAIQAAISKAATAGGSGDATEVDGDWIDRALEDHGHAMSAKLIINYSAVLGDAKTLAFGVQFQDASDSGGSDADDFGAVVPSTEVATGGSGGSTEKGVVEIDIDLSGAKQFFRAQVTPNLSAANTDTLAWDATVVLFGHNRRPVSQAIASVEEAA